jgi:hypothetical protein
MAAVHLEHRLWAQKKKKKKAVISFSSKSCRAKRKEKYASCINHQNYFGAKVRVLV